MRSRLSPLKAVARSLHRHRSRLRGEPVYRYLVSSLRAAGHEVGFAAFDRATDLDRLLAAMVGVELVGLSMCFQARAREFIALARAVKTARPEVPIVAGGHYASCAARELLAPPHRNRSARAGAGPAKLFAQGIELEKPKRSIGKVVLGAKAEELPKGAVISGVAGELEGVHFLLVDGRVDDVWIEDLRTFPGVVRQKTPCSPTSRRCSVHAPRFP